VVVGVVGVPVRARGLQNATKSPCDA
jgi:hypothetical protein